VNKECAEIKSPQQLRRWVLNTRPESLKIREFIVLSLKFFRIRTCMPGFLSYIIGWSITGEAFHWKVLLGALIAFLFQAGANLNNTVTDLREDSYNLPKRLNLVAQLGYRNLFHVTMGVNITIILLGLFFNAVFFLFVLIGTFEMLAYSFPPFRFKARPLPSMLTFAQAVGNPFLLGYFTREGSLSFSEALSIGFYSKEFWGLFILLELWFFLYCPMKNIPDYEGDKYAGLKTTATIFSSKTNAAIAAVIAHIASYTVLAFLIMFKLLPTKFLVLFIWLPISSYVFIRMIRDSDIKMQNKNMMDAMVYATAYCSTILVLTNIQLFTLLSILLSFAGIFITDYLNVDSRPIVVPEEYYRSEDIGREYGR